MIELKAIDLSLASRFEKTNFFNNLKFLYQIKDLNLKCYNYTEKNFLLKKELLLEEKILTLGKILYNERLGCSKKIKYGSIKNIKIDNSLTNNKNKYLENYVYNAIVNYSYFHYRRESRYSKNRINDRLRFKKHMLHYRGIDFTRRILK